MEIICYRDTELRRETRLLPAPTYNLAHTLLAHSPSEAVFVPIRSMQYLAILDHEEFIFLDSIHKNWIEISWQNFHPQQRSALDEPVKYDAVYYTPEVEDTMLRLQSEFYLALKQLADKERPQGIATVIKFTGQRKNPRNPT